MSWWGILLLLVGVQAAMLFVYWLLTRGRQSWPAETMKLLATSGATRLAEEAQAARDETAKVGDAMRALAEEYKGVSAWYDEHKEAIDDAARKKYDELVSDPSALDRKLDELLGSPSPTADEDETSEG